MAMRRAFFDYSLLILYLFHPNTNAQAVPFIFPHGYFDVNKLQPFDAVYLNMMAQSNIEYLGTNEKELYQLAAMRTKIPKPTNATESPFTLPRIEPPVKEQPLEQLADKTGMPKLQKETPNDFPKPPPAPFMDAFRRLRDETIDDSEDGEAPEDEGNPFAEISTRAPVGGRRAGRRKKLHRAIEAAREAARQQFLTRESILRPRSEKKELPPTTTLPPIQEPEGGFEQVFVLPMARGLQARNGDHEDQLQREWAKKSEAARSYRQHSGQGAPKEQKEAAEEYRRQRDKLAGPSPASQYQSQKEKLRVAGAAENEEDSIDILDAIQEEEIRESLHKNEGKKPSTTPKPSQKKKGPTFPTLAPELEIEEVTEVPQKVQALSGNPYHQLDLFEPTVIQLPIPPTLWKAAKQSQEFSS
ncbi:unnamed protein product, partial [Mesorhabditis spiculigera]